MANCAAITDAFVRETNRINESDYFRRNVRTRPIVDFQMSTRGAWEDGIGTVVSNLTMARNFPAGVAAARTNTAASDGISLDACLPPIINLVDGQITQSYQLRHVALQTPEYCIEDIRTSTQFEKTMALRRKSLSEISKWAWADIFTTDYVNLCAHHITCRTSGAFDNGASGYSTTNPPTGGLSMGLLESVAQQIFIEGEIPMAYDMDTGASVQQLIIGDAASRRLLRDNPTLEQAIRFAWMGAKDDSPLLPSGMEKKRRQFGGYIHNIEPYPRRFNLVNGAYVEQFPLSTAQVTKGSNQNIAPAWQFAQYEEVILWHPALYKSLAPNTMPQPSPGWIFDPVNYGGNFKALNIPNKDCNPDGNKIFWRAIFSDAAEPLNVNVGYSFLIKSCGYDLTSPNCTQSSSSSS